jgi:ABC-type transport system involved in multi-copper enzyme maturation permease subunit
VKELAGLELRPVVELMYMDFLLMAGMYVVNNLTAMMVVLTSVDTPSGEINSGTIQTLLAKPVRRWEIVLGKWLGFAAMLALYVALMAGGVAAITQHGFALDHFWRNAHRHSNELIGGSRRDGRQE